MLVNRLKEPTKHILILDDVINNQARLLQHFNEIFDHEGDVEISCLPGGAFAIHMLISGILNYNVGRGMPFKLPDLIILDHDMPHGMGDEFIKWLRNQSAKPVSSLPIITFSGIPQNNFHLMDLGANYCFEKEAVIQGLADEIIFKILGIEQNGKD